MSVIIRLQNLPWSASALDIRQYFQGLSIPEGGVHIVGGEQGDAFIAFSTDEDARQAMARDGNKLKEIKVKLLLSSRTEMQKVIETARQQSMALQGIVQTPAPTPQQPTGLMSLQGALGHHHMQLANAQMMSHQVPSMLQAAAMNELNKSKDSDRRIDNKRGRSRSRSRERRRSRDDRDKDRGGRRRGKSRSRSRERRGGGGGGGRRDRSRERSRSRDRRDRDRRRDSKDGGRDKDRKKSPPKLRDRDNRLPNGGNNNNDEIRVLWSSQGKQDNNMQGGNFTDNRKFNGPQDNWSHRGGRFDGEHRGFRGGRGGRGRFDNNNRSDDYSQQEYPQRGGGGGRQQYEDNNFGGRNQNRPFREENRSFRAPPNTCVEVSNIPTSAAYRDLREFFQEMHVLNIKLLNDEEGRRTGMAYIRFNSVDNKQAAVGLNGMMLHDTNIKVTHVDDFIYEEALDSFQPNAEYYVLAIYGLPIYTHEQDIRILFHGSRVLNVALVHSNDPSHPQAFVQFALLNDYKRALGGSGKMTFEGKELHFERSTFDNYMEIRKAVGPGQGMSSSDILNADCVRLQNLPLTIKDSQILDFFSDEGLVPQRIHIMFNLAGSPSGEAFCEFLNPAEVNRALSKHRSLLGSNEISIRPILRHEMEVALGVLKNKNEGIPPLSQMGRGGGRGGMMGGDMRNNYMGGGGPPMRGGHGYHGEFQPRGGRGFRGGSRGGGMRGGGGFRGNMHQPPMNLPPLGGGNHNNMSSAEPTVDTFGKPGCVIELNNVPYKADNNEIIEFFEGFNLTPSDICRRYNERDQPTGEARVCFATPVLAERAFNELSYKKIRERQIFMNIL